MNKEQNDKGWQAKSKLKDDLRTTVGIDADISNLNSDDSFKPIGEEEKEPLTEEEKKDIRKKLFFLVAMVIVVLILFVVVLFFNPLPKKGNNTNTTKQPETTIDEEKAALTELKDGEVKLSNKELQELTEEILYVQYDYYENNTFSIYEKENTYINNLNNQDKLFLLSKTNDFTSLMLKKDMLKDTCEKEITISKKDIDKILEDRLNTTVDIYEPFTYHIYENNKYQTTLRFTYQNETYTGTCYTFNTMINKSTQQKVVSAEKNKKQLYIDVKVVFINQTGIYKDPSFTTLIATENESFEEYIKKGNTYRYTYDISGTSYSLTNVSLLK